MHGVTNSSIDKIIAAMDANADKVADAALKGAAEKTLNQALAVKALAEALQTLGVRAVS